MYVTIYGSKKPGHYQNTGSSVDSVNYTAHDYNAFLDNKLDLPQGTELSDWAYKDMDGKSFTPETVSMALDQNAKNAHLCLADSKFFCVVFSPSEEELSVMGNSLKEKLENGQKFVQRMMDEYAKNFNKGLTDRHQLLAFSIAHYTSKKFSKKRLHWHVFVSRISKRIDVLGEIRYDFTINTHVQS